MLRFPKVMSNGNGAEPTTRSLLPLLALTSVIVPELVYSVVQRLVPSKVTALGSDPTTVASRTAPVFPSISTNALSAEQVTQIFVPSKARPLGPCFVVYAPSVAPSLGRSLLRLLV